MLQGVILGFCKLFRVQIPNSNVYIHSHRIKPQPFPILNTTTIPDIKPVSRIFNIMQKSMSPIKMNSCVAIDTTDNKHVTPEFQKNAIISKIQDTRNNSKNQISRSHRRIH